MWFESEADPLGQSPTGADGPFFYAGSINSDGSVIPSASITGNRIVCRLSPRTSILIWKGHLPLGPVSGTEYRRSRGLAVLTGEGVIQRLFEPAFAHLFVGCAWVVFIFKDGVVILPYSLLHLIPVNFSLQYCIGIVLRLSWASADSLEISLYPRPECHITSPLNRS